MSTELSHSCPPPLVQMHEVDGHRPLTLPLTSPVRNTPQTLDQTSTPALVLVVGPLESAVAQEQARYITERQQVPALLVAVSEQEDEVPPAEADLSGLFSSFDAVLTVPRGRRQQLIDRLLRTVALRDTEDQWIACDWDEVFRLAKASAGHLARYGFGRGVGAERSAAAMATAIAHVEACGANLRVARGLCVGIQAPSKALYGNEIKEVVRQLRSRINRAATITLSIGCDSTLPADSLEVDIFAFGAFSPAELMSGSTHGVMRGANVGEGLSTAWEGADPTLDPLYSHARSLVLAQQRPSISLVQRHLRIGYGRAARLLDAMEGDVLSAKAEDGSRVVLE